MPPKKRIELPDHVRKAVLADVALTYQQSLESDENAKVRIYLATEQGLDTYEIAGQLGVSQSAVSKWKLQGKEVYHRREQERDQRHGPDPERSGEREQIG